MNIGIVGLGLIGGSLAKAAKQRTQHTVFGCDVQESTFLAARLIGAVDEKLDETSIPKCEVIFLAVYPGAAVDYLREHGSEFSDDCIVVDCCGVKQTVCDQAFPLAEQYGFTFVGGHPMAGTAAVGFGASKETMFHNASMILCPPKDVLPETLDKIHRLCLELGFSRTPVVTPLEHDRRIAYTSQLAHVVSSAYIRSETAMGFRGFSAGSFRDMTRVAKLNPQMWTELFFDNRDALVNELDGLIERLQEFSRLLKQDDYQGVEKQLQLGLEAKLISDEKEKNR